jgi:hypothetical protein
MINADATLTTDSDNCVSEFEIAYILGNKTESDYDAFVSQWKSVAGDQLYAAAGRSLHSVWADKVSPQKSSMRENREALFRTVFPLFIFICFMATIHAVLPHLMWQQAAFGGITHMPAHPLLELDFYH